MTPSMHRSRNWLGRMVVPSLFLALAVAAGAEERAGPGAGEAKILSERFGEPVTGVPDDDLRNCPLGADLDTLFLPEAEKPPATIEKRTWRVDPVRRISLYTRKGRPVTLEFHIESVEGYVDETMLYYGADDPGWEESEIEQVLETLGWSRKIGRRLACDAMKFVSATVYDTYYHEAGIVHVALSSTTAALPHGPCDYPLYQRFLVIPYRLRTGMVTEKYSRDEYEANRAELESRFGALRHLLTLYPVLVVNERLVPVGEHNYRYTNIGERVTYGADACGDIRGLRPPWVDGETLTEAE